MAENRGVKYELAYANKKDKSHLSTAPKHFCQAKINPEIKKVLFLIKNWRSKEDKQADNESEFKILIRSKLVWKLKVLSFWQDLAQWTKKHVENENVDFVSGKKYNFPLNHISIFTPSTIFLQTRPAIYYFLSHKSRDMCMCNSQLGQDSNWEYIYEVSLQIFADWRNKNFFAALVWE